MDLWNLKDLPMPPVNTYKVTDKAVDVQHLGKVFLEGQCFFESEVYMKAEHAVISRIIYRMKLKLRSAKDLKAFEKVYSALNAYLETNISADLKRFIRLIPTKCSRETYLPNKNLVDYILVRLQGLVKLMERIVESCKITAYLFNKRMHTGHFWKIAIIIFSIVSRVYVVAKYITKFVCEFYNKIVPFSRQLRNNGLDWLPENYILPTDLQQWMNVDWMEIDDELQIVEPPPIPNIIEFFDLVDDEDDEIQFFDEYIMVNDDGDIKLLQDVKNSTRGNVNNVNEPRGFNIEEDVGEVIDLNSTSCSSIFEMYNSSKNDIDIINISDNLSCFETENECQLNTDYGEVPEVDDYLVVSSNDTISENIETNKNTVIILSSDSDSQKTNKFVSDNGIKEPSDSSIILLDDDELSDTNNLLICSQLSEENNNKLKAPRGVIKLNKKTDVSRMNAGKITKQISNRKSPKCLQQFSEKLLNDKFRNTFKKNVSDSSLTSNVQKLKILEKKKPVLGAHVKPGENTKRIIKKNSPKPLQSFAQNLLDNKLITGFKRSVSGTLQTSCVRKQKLDQNMKSTSIIDLTEEVTPSSSKLSRKRKRKNRMKMKQNTNITQTVNKAINQKENEKCAGTSSNVLHSKKAGKRAIPRSSNNIHNDFVGVKKNENELKKSSKKKNVKHKNKLKVKENKLKKNSKKKSVKHKNQWVM